MNNSYPYIRAWGRMLASFDYYINMQIEDARADNAPPDAIYKDAAGRWHTVADITRQDTKDQIERMVANGL